MLFIAACSNKDSSVKILSTSKVTTTTTTPPPVTINVPETEYGLLNPNKGRQYKATLSWIPPTTYTDGTPLPPIEIVSYNVYYGRTSGGPYTSRVNIPGTATSAIVNFVVGGTWYFVVTAVDSAGLESSYSDEGVKVF